MNYALIFAGGVGSRLNLDIPKQFIEINGKPILVHTVEKFNTSPLIDRIILVVLSDYVDFTKKMVNGFGLNKVIDVICGGESALDSQFNGLNYLKNMANDDDVIFIHDGVRPFINEQLLSNCLLTVKSKGSAITVSPATETIVVSGKNKRIDRIVPRQKCLLARAPQVFYFKDIFNAHILAQMSKNEYVDSASMMLNQGFNLSVVEGPAENIKITTKYDLMLCRLWMEEYER